ncbi:MAG: sensor domain-containing protein, partial [Brevibacterium sp.]|nr:sensor domain-containing protein [Brevibacterium sp.]
MNQTLESSYTDAPSEPSTYSENVPRPPDTPPQTRSWWSRMWHNLGRDAILVLPGFFISLIGFVVLITMFSVSIATLIIWIGALLLPLTLYVATGFANLSRARARQWGAPIAEVVHRPRGRGISRWFGVMAEGRRWLDLLFEMVFALPIRLFTFSVVIPWFFGALGGITYFFWGRFLPYDNTDLISLIAAWWNDTPLVDLGFGAEATFQFISGLILLVTFPFVLHAMARLEIAAITAGLAPGHDGATSAGKARAGDAWGHDPMGAASATSSGSTVLVSPAANSFLTRSAGEGWFWLMSIFVGVVLVAIGWPVTAVVYGMPAVVAMLLALTSSGALVLAVSKPIPAIVLGLVSSAAGIVLTADVTGEVWPWAVTSILALLFL